MPVMRLRQLRRFKRPPPTRAEAVQVFSYPRSGVNWFCSLLKGYFYPATNLAGTIVDPETFAMLGPRRPGRRGRGLHCPWSGLMGGHLYDPREECVQQLLRRRPTIYLARNGKDTMVSDWRRAVAENRTSPCGGFPVGSFKCYLREWLRDDTPIPVHWHWSRMLWEQQDVFTVNYEDLMCNLEDELARISLHFDLPLSQTYHDGAVPVGYNANASPRNGQWGEHADADDDYWWIKCRGLATRLLEKGF